MNYKTDFFQRAVVLNNAPLAAGTYKRGQLLGCTTATGVFGAYNPSGTGGLETVAAVCVNDAVLAAAGNGAVAKGEFEKEGLIAANTVTVNAALVAACFRAGIILN
jgi:hypothetical protein